MRVTRSERPPVPEPSADPAIQVTGLRRSFGEHEVLAGVDLAVRRGTVAALLGPNGAGKTTAVRILATLLRPHGGTVTVDGVDVARRPAEVRRRIGLVGQHAAVDEVLSGRENLVMFGRLHHLTARGARLRAEQLLDRFSLADAADRPVRTWSGGMRRRLDLAAGLLLEPAVLFLDEPTTGLDPAGRLTVWSDIRDLVAAGTTVLLTTQHLQEVDELADTVHVLDGGRVVAHGTPGELRSLVGGDRLDVVVAHAADLPAAHDALTTAFGTSSSTSSSTAAGTGTGAEPGGKAERDAVAGAIRTDPRTRTLTAPVTDRTAALAAAVTALTARGLPLEDIGLRRPSLDEVYLTLTGRRGRGGAGPESSVSDDQSDRGADHETTTEVVA